MVLLQLLFSAPFGFDFDDEESHAHPEHWSLEWLFRLPWRIKLYARTGLGASTPVLLDTFVDASQVSEARGGAACRAHAAAALSDATARLTCDVHSHTPPPPYLPGCLCSALA